MSELLAHLHDRDLLFYFLSTAAQTMVALVALVGLAGVSPSWMGLPSLALLVVAMAATVSASWSTLSACFREW